MLGPALTGIHGDDAAANHGTDGYPTHSSFKWSWLSGSGPTAVANPWLPHHCGDRESLFAPVNSGWPSIIWIGTADHSWIRIITGNDARHLYIVLLVHLCSIIISVLDLSSCILWLIPWTYIKKKEKSFPWELDGSIWNQHLSLSLDFSVLLTNHLVFISNNVWFGGWQEQLEAFFVLMGGTDHIQSSFWTSNDSIMCLMLSRTRRIHTTNLRVEGTSWVIRTT